nr:MAG TPA: hypothetical protein [Caudoviricetes sp.]
MRVVRAQSRGTCPECLEPINLGDEILPADKPQTPGRAWQHASCATGIEANFAGSQWGERQDQQDEGPTWRVAGKRKPELCPECFTEHKGECM